jgi:hypothetical protein
VVGGAAPAAAAPDRTGVATPDVEEEPDHEAGLLDYALKTLPASS